MRAFCAVNPLKPYALGEIDRCAKDPRLRLGLKLHFGNSDVDLTNADHVRQVRRVFDAANDHGMAIAVHLRASVTMKRRYGAAQVRRFLDEVLPAAPDVTVQIAHLAGSGGYEDPAIDDAFGVLAGAMAARDRRVALVYIDISAVVRPDTSPSTAARIVERVRQIGVDRVLYGSDGGPTPTGAPKARLADLARLPFTDSEFRALARNVAPYMR